MTLPGPGPTTAEWVRLFEAVHQIATDRDLERADHAETRKLAAALALDNRALQDRLAERDREIGRLTRELAEARRLVERLRSPDATVGPQRATGRLHTGPPGRCQCGPTHSHSQAVALNAGGRDRIEVKA